MNEGFIIFKRNITENEWYSDPLTMHLYMHCMVKANYKAKRRQGIEIKRGQFVTSLASLSVETGLTVKQVRSAIKKLGDTGYISVESNSRYSLITVLGYDEEQDGGKAEASEKPACEAVSGQTEGKSGANKGQTEGKQRATTNKENKENKENKDNKRCAPERVIERFNELCPSLPRVSALTKRRIRLIRNAAEQMNGDLDSVFLRVDRSDFLCGKGREWRASLDWILLPDNLIKISEGVFDNRRAPARNTSYDISELERIDTLDWL